MSFEQQGFFMGKAILNEGVGSLFKGVPRLACVVATFRHSYNVYLKSQILYANINGGFSILSRETRYSKIRQVNHTMLLRSLSQPMQNSCSLSTQYPARLVSSSFETWHSCSRKPQMASKSSSETVSSSGPEQTLEMKIYDLCFLAAASESAKVTFVIQKLSEVTVLTIIVFYCPILVIRMVISLILSPLYGSSSFGYYCLFYSSSGKLAGDLMLESSLMRYLPVSLASSIMVLSREIVQPFVLNSSSRTERSFRLVCSALIQSQSKVLKEGGAAFQILRLKLNLGVERRLAVGAARERSDKALRIMVLAIIQIKDYQN